MNDLISVIIPVYNVEKYIHKCINSVQHQTYSNLDILLIDDGSTDYSGVICDEYAQHDSRIKVFHTVNNGLAAARNKGLDEAMGDYLCFLDSDDWLDDHFVEKLIQAVKEHNVPVAFCDSNQEVSCWWVDQTQEKGMGLCEAYRWLDYQISREYVVMVTVWNKMYNRKVWNDLRFPEGKLHEDEFVIHHIIFRAQKLFWIPEQLYHYNIREESITGKRNRLSERHLDVLDALEERVSFLLSIHMQEQAVNSCKNYLQTLIHWERMFSDLSQKNETAHKLRKRYCHSLHKYKRLFSIKQKMKYGLFIIAPAIFYRLFMQS